MFPNQENTFLFLFLYLCYREDRMRLGIAKLEKLRFSFVSALAFRYLCTRYETEAYFFLYICLCMVFPAIAQMPVGNPIYGTDAYGNPVDANGNPSNSTPTAILSSTDTVTMRTLGGVTRHKPKRKSFLSAHTPGISTNASATSLP